jgi:5-methylcytosine-specific restriction endonuclease McrA
MKITGRRQQRPVSQQEGIMSWHGVYIQKQKPAKHSRLPESQDRIQMKLYARAAWAAGGKRCHYCEWPLSLKEVTADHATSRYAGGMTVRSNIKPACIACNRAKQSLSAPVFKYVVMNPTHLDPIEVHLAHFRLRLDRALRRSEARIERFCSK